MALNIKDPEVDRLARELAKAADETLTEAVATALRERLGRLKKPKAETERLFAEIRAISDRIAALPILDHRSEDEILGYGPDGLPD